jgi:hypothetical protein
MVEPQKNLDILYGILDELELNLESYKNIKLSELQITQQNNIISDFREFYAVLSLFYFYHFELAVNDIDLILLYKRYDKLQKLESMVSGLSESFNHDDSSIGHRSRGCAEVYKYGTSVVDDIHLTFRRKTSDTVKQNIFIKFFAQEFSSGHPLRTYNNPCIFELRRSHITSMSFFEQPFPDLIHAISACDWFCDPFKSSSLIYRIYCALMCDNATMLNLFIEEYKKQNPHKPVMNFIVNNGLVGIAAANGCIEVMKFFISMEVNLEQKFSLSLKGNLVHPSKIVLAQYAGTTLEMTPLALAISAAPALPEDQARTMIQLLLDARANFNNEVVKNWTETHYCDTNQITIPKSATISLFSFDQTEILDELVKKIKETKKFQPHVKGQEQPKIQRQIEKSLDDNNNSEISESRTEVKRRQQENMELKEQMQQLWSVIKQENMELKEQMQQLWSVVNRLQTSSSLDSRASSSQGLSGPNFFAYKK